MASWSEPGPLEARDQALDARRDRYYEDAADRFDDELHPFDRAVREWERWRHKADRANVLGDAA